MRARIFLTGLLLVPLPLLAQTIIVSYTFENTTTAVTGSSISALTWNSGGSEGYAATFSGLGAALSVGSFQSGDYYQITLDATGYETITLNSFRANGSASAPLDWKISYSTTGAAGTFTDISTYTLVSGTASGSTTISGITLPSSANQSTSLVFRFMATSSTRVDGGSGAANGTARLDNLSLSATAVPEPASWAALLGVLALAVVGLRRRRAAPGPGRLPK